MEIARTNTFAGGPLDRAGDQRRDEAWIAGLLQAPESRFLPLWQLRALMQPGESLHIAWRSRDEVAPYLADGATAVFLGLEAGAACFGIDVSGAGDGRSDAPFKEDGKFIDVRSCAMQCPGPEASVLAQARSLIDWHARHRFCAVCGSPSGLKEAGYMRQCLNEDCGAQHFPRTDPVTIMLVLHGERCLLGRQPRFPPEVFSALAGFVEPGECIEDAVRREVEEEAGIRIGRVRYVSSQPWPFPSSLMIGCFAYAETTEVQLDQEELEDARWFGRDEIAAMVESWQDSRALRMPPPLSIAHQLARTWLEEGGGA